MHVTFLKGHFMNSLRGKQAENVSAFFQDNKAVSLHEILIETLHRN